MPSGFKKMVCSKGGSLSEGSGVPFCAPCCAAIMVVQPSGIVRYVFSLRSESQPPEVGT